MKHNWDHVVSQVDNWIWLVAAATLVGLGAFFEVTALEGLGMACLVKIKGENGATDKKVDSQSKP